MKVKSLSRVQLIATPWTAAYQAPPSMGYSRQEYWSTKVLKCHCLLGKQYGDSLKKLGIKLPYDPAIPLLGILPKETRIERDTCIPVFTAALFTIARTWKQPRYPSADRWILGSGHLGGVINQTTTTTSIYPSLVPLTQALLPP